MQQSWRCKDLINWIYVDAATFTAFGQINNNRIYGLWSSDTPPQQQHMHTHTLTVDTQVGSMCVICVATIIQQTMVKSKVLQLYFREVQLGTIYFFRFWIFLWFSCIFIKHLLSFVIIVDPVDIHSPRQWFIAAFQWSIFRDWHTQWGSVWF